MKENFERVAAPLLVLILLLAGCGQPAPPTLQDFVTGEILAEFTQVQRSGRRDGDRLPASIVMSAEGSRLELTLLFQIGVPTSLIQGTYVWNHDGKTTSGSVRSRSITFLGGQSDNPNLGGVFELTDEAGASLFRVNVPTGEVH